MRRRLRKAALDLGVASASVVLALAAGGLLILASGHDPVLVYRVLLRESFGKPFYVSQILFKTTTLAFTGVAAAFAFRSGMFNIGGEGQLYLGAFACALAGTWLPLATPAVLAVPALLAAAALGGAVAAAPPAILKATRGTHEVIGTMMMNFIVVAVVGYFLRQVAVYRTVHTPEILAAGRLPVLSEFLRGMRGSMGNLSVALAVVVCVGAAWLLTRTRAGFDLRAVGHSPRAAEYGGVSVRRATLVSLLASGALAGLGGTNHVMGGLGYFESGFAPYQGYLGIAVALLARNSAIGVLPAAFLFATLSEGAQAIQRFVPNEIGDVLQAFVIVFVVVSAKVLDRFLERLQRRRAALA